MKDTPRMLTVSEVAREYRRHEVTVRIALQEGSLHGRQRVAGGRWLVEADCADAWSRGERCEHVLNEPINLERKRA